MLENHGSGAAMSDKHNHKGNPGCDCGAEYGAECECEDNEIEVVELEDDNGDKEEFAILDELDFEGRHFVIMAPLAEVKALHDAHSEASEDDEQEFDLSIEIFEADDDNFTLVEDEELAKRLMERLEELSEELDDEDD
jgi:hypothetical protein